MGRYLGPKVKLSRRVGVPIADNPKHTKEELTLPGMAVAATQSIERLSPSADRELAGSVTERAVRAIAYFPPRVQAEIISSLSVIDSGSIGSITRARHASRIRHAGGPAAIFLQDRFDPRQIAGLQNPD